jgi:regulator of cell morphogenesis and NO signaling
VVACGLRTLPAARSRQRAKEEQVLFPLLLGGAGDRVRVPIHVMMLEHEDHGESLACTRRLTGNLVPPPEACATWKALYLGLEQLESDLFEHIHLENNVLFPRALHA